MPKGPPPSRALADPVWLAEQIGAGLSVVEIAAAAGCSDRTVRTAIDRHGLDRPERRPHPRASGDVEVAIAAVRAGATLAEAKAAAGIGGDRLGRVLRERGVKLRPRPLYQTSFPRLHDGVWLRAQLDAGVPLAALARMVGCDRQTLRGALRWHDIAPDAQKPPPSPG